MIMLENTQEHQIKSKLHMNKLQEESVDFISIKFDEHEKDKKQKEKIKILEDNNFKMYDKKTTLEKQIDRLEQYLRHNCILLNGKPESKGDVTDDIATKTICENINDIIIIVDDIVRSHRTGKYDLQKKNPRPMIKKFA